MLGGPKKKAPVAAAPEVDAAPPVESPEPATPVAEESPAVESAPPAQHSGPNIYGLEMATADSEAPAAETPLVTILIFSLCRVAHQVIDQCQRSPVFHPDDLPHVFSKFYQAKGVRPRGTKGSGKMSRAASCRVRRTRLPPR